MESHRLADQLQRAYDGDAWHGSSLTALLDGIDAAMATARPRPSGHTIHEIVLHLTAWTREVTRRLHDGVARDPADGDWPTPTSDDEAAWAEALTALDVANADLIAVVRTLPEDGWMQVVGDARDRALGSGVSRYVLVHGLVQHHAYHGGQIALLKKAAALNDGG